MTKVDRSRVGAGPTIHARLAVKPYLVSTRKIAPYEREKKTK
jgi:hypothetical protein